MQFTLNLVQTFVFFSGLSTFSARIEKYLLILILNISFPNLCKLYNPSLLTYAD